MDLFEDVKSWLGDIGDIAREGIGIWKDIEGPDDIPANTQTPVPDYNPIIPAYYPNWQAGDFAFQPNWYLVGGAVLILALVLVVKK